MYDSNFYSLFTKLCNDQWCLIPECFPHGEETLHPSAVTFPSSLPWESLGPLSQSLDLPILDTSYNCNYKVVPSRVRLLSLYRNVFKVHPCCGASLVAQTVKNLPAMQETFPELGIWKEETWLWLSSFPSSSSPYCWEEPTFTSPGTAGLWVGIGALNPLNNQQAEVSLSRRSHFCPLDRLSPGAATTPTSACLWCIPTPTARSPWRPSSTTPSMRRGWVGLPSLPGISLFALNSWTSKQEA